MINNGLVGSSLSSLIGALLICINLGVIFLSFYFELEAYYEEEKGYEEYKETQQKMEKQKHKTKKTHKKTRKKTIRILQRRRNTNTKKGEQYEEDK